MTEKEIAGINMKKKPRYILLSLLIVIALAVPVWSTVVRADDAIEMHDWHGLDASGDDLSGSYILVITLSDADIHECGDSWTCAFQA